MDASSLDQPSVVAVVKFPLTLLALIMLAYGLWTHDWRLILAAGSVAAIWPLISADPDAIEHEELLDRLWDDDEETAA